jgi:hypothetical protein
MVRTTCGVMLLILILDNAVSTARKRYQRFLVGLDKPVTKTLQCNNNPTLCSCLYAANMKVTSALSVTCRTYRTAYNWVEP